MKDLTSIAALKRLNLFDVENPCKYYKFIYEPEMTLINTIDLDNYKTVEYEVSNYTIKIGWNMWNKMFKLNIIQDGELLRICEYGISSDTAMVYNPQFDGSYFKLIFIFDLKSDRRPLYIFRSYDVMEGF